MEKHQDKIHISSTDRPKAAVVNTGRIVQISANEGNEDAKKLKNKQRRKRNRDNKNSSIKDTDNNSNNVAPNYAANLDPAIIDSKPVSDEQKEKKRPRNRRRGKKINSNELTTASLPAPEVEEIEVTSANNDTSMNESVTVPSTYHMETKSYFTTDLFSNLDVSSNTKKALSETMGYQFMTKVQKESFADIISGHDACVKAKTGTGKTLGFLIPSVEILLKEQARINEANHILRNSNAPLLPPPVILILSPTRELAQQIEKEVRYDCFFVSWYVLLP